MASGTNIGSLFFSTGISFDGFKRDANQAKGAMSGLFNPAIIGSAALGAAMVKLGSEALDFARQYETAFAEVQTISQSARENADEMRKSILKMTTEIPVGAIDSTKALYQIVSAGFDGADAMNVLEISAKAAVAGVSTTAIAADTLTTIINAYGLSASEATNVSDALFKTVELGKTTLSEIGSSFSQVASIAASYNVSQNDILAGLASITKQGASTSEAVTRIRGALVALAKEFGPAVFQGRSLGEAFQFARDEADKSGKTYEEFFGRVEASTGILQLTGKNAIIFSDSLEKINNSAGSTEKGLAIMNDTFDSQYTILKNNLNVALNSMGGIIKGTLLPAIKGMNGVFSDEKLTGAALTIENTRKKLQDLAFSLNDTTKSEEDRLKILEEIKKISPDIAEGIKKEGEQYVISTKALSEFNIEKLNEIVLAKKLQDIQKLQARSEQLGFSAEAKLGDIQQKRIDAFQIIAKKNKEDGALVQAILDNSIGKLTEYSEVVKRFGEDNARLLNQSGLQVAETDQDFSAFQNIAIRQIAQRNGLTLDQIGLNKEFFDLVKDSNSLFTAQEAASLRASKLEENRVAIAKSLGIELDKNVKKTTPEKPSGGDGVVVPVKITISSLKEELKALNDEIETASKSDAIVLNLKIRAKENELVEFVKEISEQLEPIQVKLETFNSGVDQTSEIEKSFQKGNKELAKMSGLWVKNQKLINGSTENSENLTNNLFAASDVMGEMSSVAGNFDDELAKGLDIASGLANGVGNMVAGLAKGGDPVQAIVGGLQIVGTLLSGSGAKAYNLAQEAESLVSQIERQNRLLERQIELLNTLEGVDRSTGEKAVLSEIQDQIDAIDELARKEDLRFKKSKKSGPFGLNKSTTKITAEITGIEDLIEKYIGLGDASAFTASLLEQGFKITNEDEITDLIDRYNELLETRTELLEELTQTSSDDIADVLRDGFADGKDSIVDFAEDFETLMKNALLESFKTKYLLAASEGFFQEFGDLAQDGITSGEIETLRGSFSDLIDNASTEFDALNKVFEGAFGSDITDSAESATGAAGAISAALTEDTATELHGIWNRSLFETISHTAILTESNGYLSEIAVNTLRTADACESLDSKLNSDSSGRDSGLIV